MKSNNFKLRVWPKHFWTFQRDVQLRFEKGEFEVNLDDGGNDVSGRGPKAQLETKKYDA